MMFSMVHSALCIIDHAWHVYIMVNPHVSWCCFVKMLLLKWGSIDISTSDRAQVIALRHMSVSGPFSTDLSYDGHNSAVDIPTICTLTRNKHPVVQSGHRAVTTASEDRRLYQISWLFSFAKRQLLMDQWAYLLRIKVLNSQRLLEKRILLKLSSSRMIMPHVSMFVSELLVRQERDPEIAMAWTAYQSR
jgi:hypothetical protein